MKKIIDNEGIEWRVNKYGVVMRTGKPDVIEGFNTLEFANLDKQRELESKYPNIFIPILEKRLGVKFIRNPFPAEV